MATEVTLTARDRNKYATIMRATITGRNAAADVKNMKLYRLLDEAFELAMVRWEETQCADLNK